MAINASDAEILKRLATHLFAEGRRMFREAHLRGMDSFGAPTPEEQFERLGRAIEEERHAIALQEEAVELQRRAIEERQKQLSRWKAVSGW